MYIYIYICIYLSIYLSLSLSIHIYIYTYMCTRRVCWAAPVPMHATALSAPRLPRLLRTPGLRYKIPVFSDPDPGKS